MSPAPRQDRESPVELQLLGDFHQLRNLRFAQLLRGSCPGGLSPPLRYGDQAQGQA